MAEEFKSLTHQLEKLLPQIKDEPEPYVLTAEEEEAAIKYAINSQKEWRRWKMADKGIAEGTVRQKLSEIDWSKEIDRDAVLKDANHRKNIAIWQEQQRTEEKIQSEKLQKELQERCNAEYIWRVMSFASRAVYNKKLIVNDYTKPLIVTLCYFLSGDPRFETELGYDFNKGLLIRGITGLGKTHCVKCVEHNEINPVKILSLIEITESLKETGEFNVSMDGCKVLYLDDLGTEESMVQHYGTKIYFFKNFIEKVYLRNKVYNKLMISTNLNFAQIEDAYGVRVSSRMREMFNVIDVAGVDMRVQKLNIIKQ